MRNFYIKSLYLFLIFSATQIIAENNLSSNKLLVDSIDNSIVKINNVNNAQIVAPIAKYNWAPEAGVGVTYNISSNVFVDTAYTHIHPIGKNKPSNIDFATVGIGYSFG